MVKKHVLSNGMVVIYEKVDHVKSIALNLWIKVGSLKETEENNGVSHFIEHMIFKGSGKYSAKDIAYLMDGFGAEINAYTTKEVTCLYTKFLSPYLEQVLDVFNEMVFNPKFSKTDIDNEIEIILDEIAMYEDSPEDVVYEILTESLFKGSPLERPILGTRDTIDQMNDEIIRSFYDEFYQPENMVLSIVGNFNEESLLEQLEDVFGSHSSNYKAKAVDTTMENYEYVYKNKDIEQVHINLTFKGVPYASEKYYPFVLMNAILGGNTSSRLFQTIREEHGLTYSIYSHTAFDHDHGLLNVTFSINPKNLDKAFELLTDVLLDFKSGNITEEAFTHGKEQATNSYILALEHTEDIVESYGKYQVYMEELYSAEKTLQAIEKIKFDDVLNIAKELIDPNTLAMSMVGSLDAVEGERNYKLLKEKLGELQ